MKNYIAIFGFLLIPFLVSANFSLDDGRYFNHQLGKKVKINCTGNSIKAKGLVNYDWTRFRRAGRGQFVDRRGNSIRVIGHNAFEFRARHRNRVIVFHRDNWSNRVEHEVFGTCTNACASNCTIHHGGHPPHHDGHYSSGEYYPNTSGLEGVWTNNRYDSDVIIERTNEGLRAKLIGSNMEWTYYRQDSYDRKEYFDNRGNRYVVRSGRELVWYPKQGGSPIVLRKLR